MINTVSFFRVICLLTELSALRAGSVLGYIVEKNTELSCGPDQVTTDKIAYIYLEYR